MLLCCCEKMQRNKWDLHIYYFETVTMCYFCCIDREKQIHIYLVSLLPEIPVLHLTSNISHATCPSSIAGRGTKSLLFLFLKSSWTPSIRPFHTNCDELSGWVFLPTFFLSVLCSSLPGTPLSHCFLRSHLPWAGHQTRPSAVPPSLNSVILLNGF